VTPSILFDVSAIVFRNFYFGWWTLEDFNGTSFSFIISFVISFIIVIVVIVIVVIVIVVIVIVVVVIVVVVIVVVVVVNCNIGIVRFSFFIICVSFVICKNKIKLHKNIFGNISKSSNCVKS
jgi:hypothetical protein